MRFADIIADIIVDFVGQVDGERFEVVDPSGVGSRAPRASRMTALRRSLRSNPRTRVTELSHGAGPQVTP